VLTEYQPKPQLAVTGTSAAAKSDCSLKSLEIPPVVGSLLCMLSSARTLSALAGAVVTIYPSASNSAHTKVTGMASINIRDHFATLNDFNIPHSFQLIFELWSKQNTAAIIRARS
jgi:hypothetical protein